jgi:hypothetical protein
MRSRHDAETPLPAAPKFLQGDPVRDAEDHDEIGRIETVRSDGTVNIRWSSGRTEWLPIDDIEHVPGFTSKGRPVR